MWDGVKHHTGENMQQFLSKQNDGLLKSEWEITCELFAPYAPEENPVETIWWQLNPHSADVAAILLSVVKFGSQNAFGLKFCGFSVTEACQFYLN